MLPVALLLFLSLPPQEKNPQPVAPIPPASLEGKVLGATTGEPLRKAWVTLRQVEGRGRSQSALTDAGGRFTLKDIAPGRYTLSVDRNGFASQMYGQREPRGPGTVITLSPGQEIRDIEVRLTPAAAVSGHVYDEDGDPVPYARISALRYWYRDGQRELGPAGQAITNDLGEFRIFGLSPGRYYFSAVFEQWRRSGIAGSAGPSGESGGGAEMAYAPTYYPGTNDLGRAIPLELHAGEDIPGFDITLLSTRAARIRGRIINVATGKGADHAMVALMPRGASVRTFTFSAQGYADDPQGNFELRGVVPGAYTLLASVWDGERSYQGRVPVDVGAADIENLNVIVGPGVDIPGRLLWEGPAESREMTPRVLLQPQGEGILYRGGMGEVKADGKFTLNNVSDGDYRIRLMDTPEACYMKSARLGGDDVLQDGVSISGGKIPGPLEVMLNCAGGTIEGIVLNDHQQPATGARVVLVPDAERRSQTQLFKTTAPDQYGRFTIKGVAPGDYRLFAWEEIEPGAYEDPDFLKRYEDDGKRVAVSEGSRESVSLPLIPADKTQR
jgi:protocatechuate 3,4-dioxygenase beta subunit